MDWASIGQILAAVGAFLAAQKGYEHFQYRRHNSLSEADREFIEGCFYTLSDKLKIDRLELADKISEVVRKEGSTTRAIVHRSQGD